MPWARERFCGWGAEIGKKQSRQSNSKHNFSVRLLNYFDKTGFSI